MPPADRRNNPWHMGCTRANRDSEILQSGGQHHTTHVHAMFLPLENFLSRNLAVPGQRRCTWQAPPRLTLPYTNSHQNAAPQRHTTRNMGVGGTERASHARRWDGGCRPRGAGPIDAGGGPARSGRRSNDNGRPVAAGGWPLTRGPGAWAFLNKNETERGGPSRRHVMSRTKEQSQTDCGALASAGGFPEGVPRQMHPKDLGTGKKTGGPDPQAHLCSRPSAEMMVPMYARSCGTSTFAGDSPKREKSATAGRVPVCK